MTTPEPTCSSAVPERGVYGPCKDGFPQTGACWGLSGTPVCCNEELCGRLYEQFGGSPPAHVLTKKERP